MYPILDTLRFRQLVGILELVRLMMGSENKEKGENDGGEDQCSPKGHHDGRGGARERGGAGGKENWTVKGGLFKKDKGGWKGRIVVQKGSESGWDRLG
jgi:hypothetical protein